MSHDDVDALVEVTGAGVGVDGVRVPGLLLDQVTVAGPDQSGLWMTTVTILSSSRPDVGGDVELVRHDPACQVLRGQGAGAFSLGDPVDASDPMWAEVESVPATSTYRARRDPGPDPCTVCDATDTLCEHTRIGRVR